MQALLLPESWSANAVADAAHEPDGDYGSGDGLLINPAQPQRLRLMPALTLSPAEVDQALQWLGAALQAARPDAPIPA